MGLVVVCTSYLVDQSYVRGLFRLPPAQYAQHLFEDHQQRQVGQQMSKRLRGEPHPDLSGLRNKMSDWRACRRRTACGTDFRHGFGRVVARNPNSMNGRFAWAVSSDQLLHLSCSLFLSTFSLCIAFDFLFTRAGSLISILPNCLSLAIVLQTLPTSTKHGFYTISQRTEGTTMRFPSFFLAAVAGLWQQPLVSEEETVTSTRHIHVTRIITNFSSTIYAVRMGTSTIYMKYLPATLTTKFSPWQALQATHLELRAEATSTMHIKVTQTVAQSAATVFASKVGTSISTITNAPQSLVEQAAEDAIELSSSQLAAAISSAKADALTHSTVALLASTTPSSTPELSAPPSPTQPEPAQFTNSSSSPTSTQSPAASPSSNGSSETMLPIGLELRSNGGTTTNVQLQATTIQAPSTVTVVVYSSSPTAATSVSPSLEHSAALSQTSTTSASSIPQPSTSLVRSTQTAQATQVTSSVPTSVAVDTNAAQVKSIQTALIQPSTYSDEAAATSSSALSSTTAEGCTENCAPQTSVSTVVSTSYSSSTSSNRVYTIPVTMTGTTSTPSTDSTVLPSAAQTSGSATSLVSYGAQSSDSSAADIAADNAAGASGGDSGSFKLSKGGFAAIISVVSVGVGLGSTLLILP
jgi:hypothetical protein